MKMQPTRYKGKINSSKASKNLGLQKRGLYIKIGIASIIVIIAALVVMLIVNKNKDTKDLYFQTEIKNFVNSINDIQKKQNDNLAKNKPFKENPSRTRYELSANLSKTNNGDNKNQDQGFVNLPSQAMDIINSSKLVLNSRYNIKEGINTSTLSFLLEGQNFIDINTLSKGDTIGLKIPIIYDKYIIMDKNNVSGAFEKLNIDIPIKSLFSVPEFKAATFFSIIDSKNIFLDYFRFIQESISDKNILLTKNVTIEQIDYSKDSLSSTLTEKGPKKTAKYDVFSLNFTEGELKPILMKTIEVLCSDNRLIDMTTGNLDSTLDLLEESGYLNISSLIKTAVSNISEYTNIEYIKSELISKINDSSFPDGFKMDLIVDSSGNIVDRKITFSTQALNDTKRKYVIQTGQFFTKVKIEQESSSSGGDDAIIEFEKVEKNKSGDLYLSINCENNMWPDFKLKINSEVQKSTDDKRKAINSNYLFDIQLTAQELGFNNAKMLLDIKREDRYNIEFDFPELNDETSVDLKEKDKAKIDGLIRDIQFSAAKFLLGNQSILKAFISD